MLLLALPVASHAAGAAELASAVMTHLEQVLPATEGRRQVRVHALDERLRLADCTQPLQLELTGERRIGRVSVRVRCPSPVWQVYVPAEISSWREVLVASAPLARNHVLSRRDVVREEREVTQHLQSAYSDPARVIGMRLKRNVSAGQTLTPRMLAAPLLVRRNQPVAISTERGGVRVSATSGIALSDGEFGQRIRVRNSRSGRVLQAHVNGHNSVSMQRPVALAEVHDAP